MNSNGADDVPTQIYQDFVPTSELVQEQDSDTLLLNLKNNQASPTPDTQQPKKPADHEQQTQGKDEENAKSEKTAPREELPKQGRKTPSRENEQTTEERHGNRTSSRVGSKLEYDAYMGNVAALAEKLKMPRKVMNMTLVAILVLGIVSLYVSIQQLDQV